MASNISDDARRSEIRRRTLRGIKQDIDDLRGQLREALPTYEQRLRRRTDALPDWLKLPPTRLRNLFHFTPDGIEAQAILGPRAVALGAERLETCVDRWLDADIGASADADDPVIGEVAGDYHRLQEDLGELRASARQAAEQADRRLDAWRDAVLTELDTHRETDIEAIEELVREGEIGRGRNARQEIADLWEEQRNQAAELQAGWSPIAELVDEGRSRTIDGVDQLEDMLERARQGLVGSSPTFEELLNPRREGSQDRPNGAGDDGPDDQDNSAKKLVPDRGDGRGDDDPTHQVCPAGPTAPIDGPPTGPAVDESDAATGADTDRVRGIVPLDEPTSDPEMGVLESSSVSDYSEPDIDVPAELLDRTPTATQQQFKRTEPSADPLPDQSASRPAQRDGSAPAPADDPLQHPTRPGYPDPDSADSQRPPNPAHPAGRGPDKAPPAEHDDLSTQCFRVHSGFEPVPGGELAAVLGPPLAALLIMGAMSAAHMCGASSVANPMIRWTWAPTAAVVAAVWVVIVPVALKWRTRWSGWRVHLVHCTDVRQQEVLTVDADNLTVGSRRWSLDRLDSAQMGRWDSPLDDVFGWVLAVDPPSRPTVSFVAPADDRDTWRQSAFPLVDIDHDAWQLADDDFDDLRRRVMRQVG